MLRLNTSKPFYPTNIQPQNDEFEDDLQDSNKKLDFLSNMDSIGEEILNEIKPLRTNIHHKPKKSAQIE